MSETVEDLLRAYQKRALSVSLLVSSGFLLLGVPFRFAEYMRNGAKIHLVGIFWFCLGTVILLATWRAVQKRYSSWAVHVFLVMPLVMTLAQRSQRFHDVRIDIPVTLFAVYVLMCILSAMLLSRRWAFVWCSLYTMAYIIVHAIPFWLYPEIPGTTTNKAATVVMPVPFFYLLTWLSQWTTTHILEAFHQSESQREALTKSNQQLQHTNTELEQARLLAQEASQAKSQFLANMSHELRTPLNAVIGYTEILQEELGDIEEVSAEEELQHILTASQHLLSLIEGLFDLVRIEEGHLILHMGPTNIKELLGQVQAITAPLCARNQNQLTVEIHTDLDTLHTDAQKLQRCLINLLDNAAKFTQNGAVTLQVDQDTKDGQPWLVFAVKDTGIGMSEQQIAQSIEPFWQADRSSRRRYDGSGLGLALTHELCRHMGGTLHIQSIPHLGSTFSIRLPLSPPPETPNPQP